jgi:cytochrome c oxidase subunit 3
VARRTLASERDDGPREPSFGIPSGQLGMLVLLASLSVLFVASLVACVITRAQNRVWVDMGMPPLPKALWLSTAMILGTSLALELTRRRTRQNHLHSAARALGFAWVSALLFITCQVQNWISLGSAVAEHTTLYPFTFFFLTGLHAAHVVLGFIPLGLVTLHLRAGEYSSSRQAGLNYCVQYWHFLGAVWLILFGALLITC